MDTSESELRLPSALATRELATGCGENGFEDPPTRRLQRFTVTEDRPDIEVDITLHALE